jgi:tetratricopeptide (TPR) repeat protein
MPSRRQVIIVAALFLATMLIYGQVIDFGFVHYDDHHYVTQNPHVLSGLTAGGIAWAFTTFEAANWHPLTWLSHMLDVQLGLHAGGMHLVNALLHATNAALLFLLLAAITASTWRSAMVAALFALHPLHVESVAWISERKDVLSTFFGLLAMIAYVRHARAERRDLVMYAVMTACFVLSLLSKPMLVTLPLLLLLLDFWPLRRVQHARDWRACLLEKIPLAMISAASCIVTIAAQRAGGAVRDMQQASLAQRAANAIIACGEYAWQTIWPAKLAVFYPYPHTFEAWRMALAAIAMTSITIACAIACRRGFRAPLVGWLWYLIALLPVLGLVQVGAQAHADRYTYVPLVGVFITFAWSLPGATRASAQWSAIIASTIVVILAGLCWVQVGYWRDSISLGQHALDVTERNAVAHMIIANAQIDERDYSNAVAHLQLATQIDPLNPQAWHNLGFALDQTGETDQAIEAYRQAIARRPDFAENHYNIGLLLQKQNRPDEARAALLRAADLAGAAGDVALRRQALDRLSDLTR